MKQEIDFTDQSNKTSLSIELHVSLNSKLLLLVMVLCLQRVCVFFFLCLMSYMIAMKFIHQHRDRISRQVWFKTCPPDKWQKSGLDKWWWDDSRKLSCMCRVMFDWGHSSNATQQSFTSQLQDEIKNHSRAKIAVSYNRQADCIEWRCSLYDQFN